MGKRVSLKDIANTVGVSTAVVSYVLNDKYEGRVSKMKAEAIKRVAKEMNYFPNHIAKSLKRDQTFTIGLIIADISNLFYSNIARHIENECRKYGYHVIFGSADENTDKFNELVEVMLGRQVDGLILAAPKDAEEPLCYLRDHQIPFVLIDRYFPSLTNINTIAIDNFNASYRVIAHVAHNHYRSPAMVTLRTDLFHMQDRVLGFRTACAELMGLRAPKVTTIQEEMLSDEIESCILNLLKGASDLLYFSTNKIAMAGLAVLVKHGVKVPDDVGVVCFDEAEAYRIFNTSITFVRQPLQEIGNKSVNILRSLINGTDLVDPGVLNTEIIVGNSSASRLEAVEK